MDHLPIKVFLTVRILPEAFELLKSKGYEITSYNHDGRCPRHILLDNVESIDALYCMGDKIDEELLDRAKNLKVVATSSVGYDQIDVRACHRRGIRVGHTPDVLTEACAELGVALMLCTSRRLIEANREVIEGRWGNISYTYMCGVGIQHSTVGIVGMGRIGCSMAEKLKGFHPKEILYNNRSPSDKANALGAIYATLDELLRCSDFVVSCCPMSAENAKMFNADRFAMMKPTAQFFNLSRGGVVDQEALYDALANGKLRAAGLDVCTPEPLPKDHKLLKLYNFVVLPHIASATYETRNGMCKMTVENIIAALEGRKMPAEVPY